MYLTKAKTFLLFGLFILPYCLGIPKWVAKRISKNKQEKEQLLRLARIGLKKGLSECRRQFRWERWNCSFPKKVTSKILKRRYIPKVTREIAFMNAITSAAVALQLAEACQKGKLKYYCTPPFRKMFTLQHVKEDTRYGMWIVEFLTNLNDPKLKKKRRGRVAAIHHNNKIGRYVVKYMARRQCRCQGTSGNCIMKTCNGRLPTLREVGTTIKYLYKLAYKGIYNKRDQLKPIMSNTDLADMLVYLSDSPDYCKRDKTYNSFGTRGRVCRVPHRNSTRASKGHCEKLCYSCGYTIKYEVRPKKVRCNCKFRWCCEVKCDTCYEKEDVLVCN